jgi:hypothetical protein
MSQIEYRDYIIETFQPESGSWQARIRRKDGRPIKTKVPEGE